MFQCKTCSVGKQVKNNKKETKFFSMSMYKGQNGSGFIDSDEITAIVLGLLKIASKSIVAEEVEMCVKEVREAIDNDDDGNISKEDL